MKRVFNPGVDAVTVRGGVNVKSLHATFPIEIMIEVKRLAISFWPPCAGASAR
jgi:hypothetical protein